MTEPTKDNIVTNSQVLTIKMSASQSPKLVEDQFKGIIKWGSNNRYPAEKLLYWYENSAIHGAICKGKARYLSGTKITADIQSPQVDEFLSKANALESWHDLKKKIDIDEVVCGGYFIKVYSNAFGVPIQFFHLDFARCRITKDGKFIKYSNDWSDNLEPVTAFPVYNEGIVETSVYYYKSYSPSSKKFDGLYPKPEYEQCSQDIDTDARVSVFFNSLVRNNFSAGTIVTIRNGSQEPAAKKALVDRLKGEHAGEENAGKPIIIFTGKDGQPTEVVSLNPNDLDKQYEGIGMRNQQNIIAGHGVNSILFKIKTAGQLGGRTELIEAHELFVNEYVKPKQVKFNNMLAEFFLLKYNMEAKFDVEQVKLIGKELPLDNVNVINAIGPEVFKAYIFDTFGLKKPEDVNGVVIEQGKSNDNLRGLSASENADVIRITRDFSKGRMPESMAMHRLTAYGLTTTQAKEILGLPIDVQQSADNSDKLVELFNKYAHDINFDDEIIDIQSVQLAEANTDTEIRNSILNELKGDPSISIYKLSKMFSITEDEVKGHIAYLESKKLVQTSPNGIVPTEKGANKTIEPVQTEIYTEYVYALRQDQEGKPLIINTTRQFCRDMVAMTRTKALTFEAINMLENEFGDDAWYFKGGFYNNGKVTTPFCRHTWKAVTKIRKKK